MTRRGFTLIEAVVAMVILAVAVPPMMWALREAAWRRGDAAMMARARWLAAERVEDVLADRQSSSRGFAWVTDANYPDEPSLPGFTGLSRRTRVVEAGADLATPQPGSGTKVVTVTVSFTDSRGAPRGFSLSSVVTNY